MKFLNFVFVFITLNMLFLIAPVLGQTASYVRLINKTDSLISTTFAVINKESETANSATTSVKTMNKENCEQLNTQLIPQLEQKLLDEFGGDENINNQIHPFIVSLKECTEALQKLTIDQIYKADKFTSYANAFLFKELAKGNLFRSLGNVSTDRKRFTFSLSYGALFSDMGTQIKNQLIKDKWVNGGEPAIYKSGNDYVDFKFDYKVSGKISIAFGYHNLPQYGASGYKITADTAKTKQWANEFIKGNSIGLNCAYALYKVKASGYGFEAKIGLGVDYNLCTLKQEISQELNINNFNQQLIIYNLTMNSSEYLLHSLGININGNANYHFNKNVSLQLGMTYYFDFGMDVPALEFQNSAIEKHTLNYNAFGINVGLATHF